MLRLNNKGELVETMDYNIHGEHQVKKINQVDDFRKSSIGSEKEIIEEDQKRKNIQKMHDDYKRAWLKKNQQKIMEEKRALRNYERKVLQDQENIAERDRIRDAEIEAYLSYKGESENPNYNKASKSSDSLGWAHLPPSKDYNVFHSGLKFGVREGEVEDAVITYSHMSPEKALSKEKYLTPQEEKEVRKGLDAGMEKRVDETENDSMQGFGNANSNIGEDYRVSYQANASFGDFWSDLRDDFIKDVKQTVDEELTYENLKDIATDQLKKELAPEGGQVETMPDGTRVIRMPNRQPMMIPQPSGIDTKTLLIGGGALIGTVLLVSLLRRR